MSAAGLDSVSQQASAAGAHEALPLAIINTLKDGSLDVVPPGTSSFYSHSCLLVRPPRSQLIGAQRSVVCGTEVIKPSYILAPDPAGKLSAWAG